MEQACKLKATNTTYLLFHSLNQQSDALNSVSSIVFPNSKTFSLRMTPSISIDALLICSKSLQRVFFCLEFKHFFSSDANDLSLLLANVVTVFPRNYSFITFAKFSEKLTFRE